MRWATAIQRKRKMTLLSRWLSVFAKTFLALRLTQITPTSSADSTKEVNQTVGQTSASRGDECLMELITQSVDENQKKSPDYPSFLQGAPSLPLEATEQEP